MGSDERARLEKAAANLGDALKSYAKRDTKDELAFLTVSKAFEVAVEYGWRELRRRVENEGNECTSPKDAVRQSARMGIIDEPAIWIRAIESRNASVHDYFGIGEEAFIAIAKKFLKSCKEYLETNINSRAK